MGVNVCTVVLVIIHGVVSAIALGLMGHVSYEAFVSTVQNTTNSGDFVTYQSFFGPMNVSEKLAKASLVINVICIWAFIQGTTFFVHFANALRTVFLPYTVHGEKCVPS